MKLTDDQRTILNAVWELGNSKLRRPSSGELTDYLNQSRPRCGDWTYGQVASSLARMERRGLVVKSKYFDLRNEWGLALSPDELGLA